MLSVWSAHQQETAVDAAQRLRKASRTRGVVAGRRECPPGSPRSSANFSFRLFAEARPRPGKAINPRTRPRSGVRPRRPRSSACSATGSLRMCSLRRIPSQTDGDSHDHDTRNSSFTPGVALSAATRRTIELRRTHSAFAGPARRPHRSRTCVLAVGADEARILAGNAAAVRQRVPICRSSIRSIAAPLATTAEITGSVLLFLGLFVAVRRAHAARRRLR